MVATKKLSVAEFAAMLLIGHWELIDGTPIESLLAVDEASAAGASITAIIWHHVRANRLGRVYNSRAGFVLFPDRATVRSPDAAFVRRERLPEFTDRFVPIAPDLAVGVLSPSDRIADALSKVAMYLEAGVFLVWLVDPATHTATIFRPDATPRTVDSEGALEGGEVLPGFVIPLAEVFDRV